MSEEELLASPNLMHVGDPRLIPTTYAVYTWCGRFIAKDVYVATAQHPTCLWCVAHARRFLNGTGSAGEI